MLLNIPKCSWILPNAPEQPEQWSDSEETTTVIRKSAVRARNHERPRKHACTLACARAHASPSTRPPRPGWRSETLGFCYTLNANDTKIPKSQVGGFISRTNPRPPKVTQGTKKNRTSPRRLNSRFASETLISKLGELKP